MSKVVKVENISFLYDDEEVLSNVCFEINEGDYVAFCGENGSGKTTLLKLLGKIQKPKTGKITNTFKNISYLSQINMNKKNFFLFSVDEVVSLGLKNKPFAFLTKKDKEKIDEFLELLNIKHLKNKRFDEISGGEQEKARIAKCLISEPDLLLLDEPSSGLDEKTRDEIYSLLDGLHHKKKTTIVLVSHNHDELEDCNKFVHFFKDKRIEVYNGHHEH